MQAAEIFDHFLGRKPPVERGGGGEETRRWRDLLRVLRRMSKPATMAVPEVGARMVASMRKVVVFPAPLAPSRP